MALSTRTVTPNDLVIASNPARIAATDIISQSTPFVAWLTGIGFRTFDMRGIKPGRDVPLNASKKVLQYGSELRIPLITQRPSSFAIRDPKAPIDIPTEDHLDEGQDQPFYLNGVIQLWEQEMNRNQGAAQVFSYVKIRKDLAITEAATQLEIACLGTGQGGQGAANGIKHIVPRTLDPGTNTARTLHGISSATHDGFIPQVRDNTSANKSVAISFLDTFGALTVLMGAGSGASTMPDSIWTTKHGVEWIRAGTLSSEFGRFKMGPTHPQFDVFPTEFTINGVPVFWSEHLTSQNPTSHTDSEFGTVDTADFYLLNRNFIDFHFQTGDSALTLSPLMRDIRNINARVSQLQISGQVICPHPARLGGTMGWRR